MVNGLLNVYKEAGFTSFDVIAVLRGILHQKKIGHTGTLDPAAEGVLLVCLGNATRLCDALPDETKEYLCTMLLGTVTDTEDTTGKIIETNEINVSNDEIIAAINSFVGENDQIPPMYSAIKVDGKKLYELARSGKEIERKPRRINIFDIHIEKIQIPYVTFKVKCSKGTYIRSLCRDIGNVLGCGAAMSHLVRTAASSYTIDNALKLDEIKELAQNGRLDEKIVSAEKIFSGLEGVFVSSEAKKLIDNGNPLKKSNLDLDKSEIDFEEEDINSLENRQVRVYNAEGRFVGIYRFDGLKKMFMPYRMFQSIGE